jgi:acyl carrier protein
MDQKTAIREFLKELLSIKNDSAKFADSDSLLLSGRLQSLDAVRIVLHLEETYGVNFAKVGFDPEKIDSVDAIGSLLPPTGNAPSNAPQPN